MSLGKLVVSKIAKQQQKAVETQKGFMRIVIDSLTDLPGQFAAKTKSFILRISLKKNKFHFRELPKQKLNSLNINLLFPCEASDVLIFELFKNEAELTPYAYVQFPIKKFYQIEKVRHCICVDLADFKKFTSKKLTEVFGVMNLEMTIFREDIGRIRFKTIQAIVQKGVEKYFNKDVCLVIKTNKKVYELPMHHANGKNPCWQEINIDVENILSQVTFQIYTVGTFGPKLIGEERMNVGNKGFFETPDKFIPIDLSILRDEERVFVLRLVSRFQFLEDDLSF